MEIINSHTRSLCTLSLLLILFVNLSFSIETSFVKHFLGAKEGNKIEGLNHVRQYLIKYGYMNSASGSLPQQAGEDLFDDNMSQAVKKYQRFFHLNSSGVLDENTLSQMSVPRCGMPDFINGTDILHGLKLVQYASNGSYYVFWGSKWTKFNLTWGIRPGTSGDAWKPIGNALEQWGSVSKFKFYPGAVFEGSDLQMSFFRGAHGDDFPFDGPGNVLAHSFPPPVGKLHFDADETWVNGAVRGSIDIGTVALHEIGHLLGLEHSQVESSIMWPSIRPGEVKGLGRDDIDGINALYP